MTSDDFDWCEDPSIVLQEQPPTAIYTNVAGAVVIRQGGDFLQTGDQIVVVRPENVVRLVTAILTEAGYRPEIAKMIIDRSDMDWSQAETDFEAIDAHAPKDRTNAERQRRYRDRKRNGVTLELPLRGQEVLQAAE